MKAFDMDPATLRAVARRLRAAAAKRDAQSTASSYNGDSDGALAYEAVAEALRTQADLLCEQAKKNEIRP